MHNVPFIKLSPCGRYLATATVAANLHIYDVSKPGEMLLLTFYHLEGMLWNVQWVVRNGIKLANRTLNDYILIVASNSVFYLLDIPIKNEAIELRLLDKMQEYRQTYSMSRLYLCKFIPELDLFVYSLQFTSCFYLLWVSDNGKKNIICKEDYSVTEFVDVDVFYIAGLDANYKNELITIYLYSLSSSFVKIEIHLEKDMQQDDANLITEPLSVTVDLPKILK